MDLLAIDYFIKDQHQFFFYIFPEELNSVAYLLLSRVIFFLYSDEKPLLLLISLAVFHFAYPIKEDIQKLILLAFKFFGVIAPTFCNFFVKFRDLFGDACQQKFVIFTFESQRVYFADLEETSRHHQEHEFYILPIALNRRQILHYLYDIVVEEIHLKALQIIMV